MSTIIISKEDTNNDGENTSDTNTNVPSFKAGDWK